MRGNGAGELRLVRIERRLVNHMIVDAHAHVSDTDYGNGERLIERMDEAGVDKTVIVPGGTVDVREMSLFVTGEKRAISNTIPNEVVYRNLERHRDRLIGFFGINPLEEAESFDTFDTAVAKGCVGIKLNPIAHRFSFAGRVLDEIAEQCAKRAMPIYAHVLFDPGANTIRFGEFARRHPSTQFILGHMGFGSCDAHAFRLAKELPNFYLETSLGNYLAISEAIRIAGDRKLLFGSEYPMSYAKIGMFQIREFPAATQARILGENIARLIPALA